MDKKRAQQIAEDLAGNIRSVIKGKDDIIRKILAALFAGGHVLLEDVPGTGKTTLAKTIAKSIGTDFRRVQFTSDLLPSDLLGISIYSQKDNAFSFNKGPIFTNILLADEINRANPRTQSALLEAMGEQQITIEGRKYPLSQLFFVIATENPIESHGTYPLPESQVDRFMVKLSPGYVSQADEIRIISDQLLTHPIDTVNAVVDENAIFNIMARVKSVQISEELLAYIVRIISATRQDHSILVGASTRASISLAKMSQAMAFLNARDFIIPEDVQAVASDVISHRIQLHSQARFSGSTAEAVVKQILGSIDMPK